MFRVLQRLKVRCPKESHIRVKKISRILDSLLCPVSQPLLHCKGWTVPHWAKHMQRAAWSVTQFGGSLSLSHYLVKMISAFVWCRISKENIILIVWTSQLAQTLQSHFPDSQATVFTDSQHVCDSIGRICDNRRLCWLYTAIDRTTCAIFRVMTLPTRQPNSVPALITQNSTCASVFRSSKKTYLMTRLLLSDILSN